MFSAVYISMDTCVWSHPCFVFESSRALRAQLSKKASIAFLLFSFSYSRSSRFDCDFAKSRKVVSNGDIWSFFFLYFCGAQVVTGERTLSTELGVFGLGLNRLSLDGPGLVHGGSSSSNTLFLTIRINC